MPFAIHYAYMPYLDVVIFMWSFVGKLLLAFSYALASDATAGGFSNFQPSDFSEHAAMPFFFSIGKQLKFGDAIREDAPTLLEGDMSYVLPSPNQQKAAVVLGDSLYLVQPGKPPIKLLHPYGSKKRVSIGDSYYGNTSGALQWDSQSRYIFIPKSTVRESVNRQYSFQTESSLERIDTNDPIVKQELVPSSQFSKTLNYFLLRDDSVCGNVATITGNMRWKCWISGTTHSVERLEIDRITFMDGTAINAKPFRSYWQTEGGEVWLALGGYSLTRIPNTTLVELFHSGNPNRPILRVEGVIEPLKGHFLDGFSHNESTILPGGRFALVTVLGHKLLVDSETGLYKDLPKSSRIFLNFNSYSSEGWFRIIDHRNGFFEIEEGRTKRLRTNYN